MIHHLKFAGAHRAGKRHELCETLHGLWIVVDRHSSWSKYIGVVARNYATQNRDTVVILVEIFGPTANGVGVVGHHTIGGIIVKFIESILKRSTIGKNVVGKY